VYIQNCNAFPGAPDWPLMFGAVEAISRAAVQAYFGGAVRCRSELPWQAWGEDYFMSHCLDHLGVPGAGDFAEIADAKCMNTPPWCGDHWKAAYHPLKNPAEWIKCWDQAVAR